MNTRQPTIEEIQQAILEFIQDNHLSAQGRLDFLNQYETAGYVDEKCIQIMIETYKKAAEKGEKEINEREETIRLLEQALAFELEGSEQSLHKQILKQGDQDIKDIAQHFEETFPVEQQTNDPQE